MQIKEIFLFKRSDRRQSVDTIVVVKSTDRDYKWDNWKSMHMCSRMQDYSHKFFSWPAYIHEHYSFCMLHADLLCVCLVLVFFILNISVVIVGNFMKFKPTEIGISTKSSNPCTWNEFDGFLKKKCLDIN